MNRLTLERRPVWIYRVAIGVGLAMGSAAPGLGRTFEARLWPALALLLYVSFVQVLLLHLREPCTAAAPARRKTEPPLRSWEA